MTKTTGVILLNMGGPERLDDVAPFLYNLFSDRDIIRLGPRFLQKPLARLISRRRAPKSRINYEKIGGSSPLTRISRQQALALESELSEFGTIPVTCAMRYWNPRASEAVQIMKERGIERLIALPLYPHYSRATTGSSLKDLKATLLHNHREMELVEIPSWPTQPSYIKALSSAILEGIQSFSDEPVEVVYSAHSLPVSFIEEGDPYLDEIKKTIEATETITGRSGHLCFQSRSGPVEWLSPSTPEMITRLADQGVKNILMIPISFVSDHIETLYEIDMLYADQAKELGMTLRSSRSLNTDSIFIQGLKELILDHISP